MAKKTTPPAAPVPVEDKWSELKTELEALGIFKLGGWVGKNLFSWVLKTNEERFTTHFYNVFMAMPYAVVYVFERATYELEDAEEIDGNLYRDRLSLGNMPRELSDEYRLQQVQGAYDALWGSKGVTIDTNSAEDLLEKWVKAAKFVIRHDANLSDDEWRKTLSKRNLDRPLIPASLPEKNKKLRKEVERLEKVQPFVMYACVTLIASIVIYAAFAVLEIDFFWLRLLIATLLIATAVVALFKLFNLFGKGWTNATT